MIEEGKMEGAAEAWVKDRVRECAQCQRMVKGIRERREKVVVVEG